MAARTAPGCGQQYGSVCHVRCQTAPTIAQRPARHRAAVSGSQRQEGPLDWQQPRGQQDELHSQHAPVPAAIPASHGGDPAPKDAAEGVADSRQRRQPPHANEKQPQPQGAWLLDPLTTDILSIALPMLATLGADPIAGLVDTAYIGRLGAAQLAGVGVALSVFNTTTKLFNVPLLSVTTSSVAAAAGRAAAAARAVGTASSSAASSSGQHAAPSEGSSSSSSSSTGSGGMQAASAALSSAISSSALIAAAVGAMQALLLLGGGAWVARLWGVAPSSALWDASSEFLTVRAAGAPVTVLLLVMQGAYRGLADTRTPLVATLASNGLNVVLGYALVFGAGLGVRGAAIATVVSQVNW